MSVLALLFPGQGAQAAGMGQDLWAKYPSAREVFSQADQALGMFLSDLCFNGPEERLRLTENAQPAILTASMAAYRVLVEASPALAPAFLAGHSLGEYSALVAAGVLDFATAVRLVRERGRLMAAAQPAGTGAMAAILGIEPELLRQVLARAGAAGPVEVANLNSPGQVVISGATAAVSEAGRLAAEAGASKVIPLQVSGPFHSSLMRPAAEAFANLLAGAEFHQARVPVVANVTAAPATNPDDIRRLLVEQVYSPVRWEESVRFMRQAGVESFIELGPGRVLSGLVKRIDRTARLANIGDESGLKETLAFLGEV